MPGRGRQWRLDPREVIWKAMGYARTDRSKARLPRSLDLRSEQITAEHAPTGLTVTGQIPLGNYSRDQQKRLRQELRDRLLAELETKVARHLRISDR
jgi:hypothetical protein